MKFKYPIMWGLVILFTCISFAFTQDTNQAVFPDTTNKSEPNAEAPSPIAVDTLPSVPQKGADSSLVSTSSTEPIETSDSTPMEKTSLAVLFFQNKSKDSKYNSLQNALTDMITTDLSQVTSLTLLERSKMASLMNEKEFSASDLSQAQNRSEISKLLPSKLKLTGVFNITPDNQMTIQTAFIDSETGKLKKVSKTSGALEKFFELEKKVVFDIVEYLGIKLTDEERTNIQLIKTENILAAMAYGKGLNARDRGDFDAANNAFANARALDPKLSIQPLAKVSSPGSPAPTPGGPEDKMSADTKNQAGESKENETEDTEEKEEEKKASMAKKMSTMVGSSFMGKGRASYGDAYGSGLDQHDYDSHDISNDTPTP